MDSDQEQGYNNKEPPLGAILLPAFGDIAGENVWKFPSRMGGATVEVQQQ